MFAFTLLGGAWIFALVIVGFAIAVAFSLYSLGGSAINRHPYHQASSGAPGAFLPDEMSDRATFEDQYLHLKKK